MYRVDPQRLDLVQEFLADPLGAAQGRHSLELRRLTYWLRRNPAAGRFVLVPVEKYRSWKLCRLTGERGTPLQEVSVGVFSSIEDAERHVFKLRWSAETGQALPETLS